MDVIYSQDDEGNQFQIVITDGCVGKFEGDYYGEFTPYEILTDDLKDKGYEKEDFCSLKEINCVVIN